MGGHKSRLELLEKIEEFEDLMGEDSDMIREQLKQEILRAWNEDNLLEALTQDRFEAFIYDAVSSNYAEEIRTQRELQRINEKDDK